MSTAELFRAEMRSIFTTRVLSPGDLAPFVGHNSAKIYLLSYTKCMHAKHHDENVKWKVERVQIVISFFFKFKLWKKSSQIWLLIVPLTLNCTCTLNAFSALTYHFKQSYNQKYSLRYRPDYYSFTSLYFWSIFSIGCSLHDHTSYATLLSGMSWNIPGVTCTFWYTHEPLGEYVFHGYARGTQRETSMKYLLIREILLVLRLSDNALAKSDWFLN